MMKMPFLIIGNEVKKVLYMILLRQYVNTYVIGVIVVLLLFSCECKKAAPLLAWPFLLFLF